MKKSRFLAAVAVPVLLALPAQADDIEASIEAALDAYRAGDVKTAKEELDFAAQLLAQQKAEGLGDFLPAPLPGWTRDEAEVDTQAVALLGGQMATAVYTDGAQDVEIQIVADNQMVTAFATMFANPALMGAMGKVKRLNGQRVVLTPAGEVQALIDRRIMVQISGSADDAVKEAYFEAIDVDGLSAY